MVERSPDALIVIRDDRIVFLNPMALGLFGAESAERILGMPPCELFHWDCRDAMRARVALVLAGQCVPLVEGKIVRFDEAVVDVEVAASPFADENGSSIQVIFRDITRRKAIEEALSQSERQHRLLFETMLQGVVYRNSAGIIIGVNPAAERIVGRPAAELLGHTSTDLDCCAIREDGSPFPPEEYPSVVSLKTGREVKDVVIGVFNPIENRLRWVIVDAIPQFRPGDDQPYQVYTTLDDVTERRHAVQALQRAHDELEQKVRERTAELESKNAQLRSLTLELTRAEGRERRRVAQVLHDHLQQLLVGARYCLGSVRGSPEAGRLKLVRETAEKVDSFLGEAIEASRSLTYELSPPILRQRSLAEALEWLGKHFERQHHLVVKVTADPRLVLEDEDSRLALYHAVRELLFNIVKHAQVEQACIRAARSKGGKVRITVSDRGVGFDPAHARAREGVDGGFGLFSLRERLELLGGGLDIESSPGRGSRITISTP